MLDNTLLLFGSASHLFSQLSANPGWSQSMGFKHGQSLNYAGDGAYPEGRGRMELGEECSTVKRSRHDVSETRRRNRNLRRQHWDSLRNLNSIQNRPFSH